MKSKTMTISKLSKLIADLKFDYVNSDIKDDSFDEPKELGTVFELVHFDKYISSEDAIKELSKDGWRPANAWELLEYAKSGWNNKDWVVALGSTAQFDVHGRYVLGLDAVGSGRGLGLGYWGGDWSASCRFLRVRNSSQNLESLEKPSTLALGTLDSSIEQAIKVVKEAGYRIFKEI